MKRLLSFWLFSISLFAQSYFSPVAPTGLPYIVIINQITINGLPPAMGTEIAVFDDTLCVGAMVISDTLTGSIITWQGNNSLALPGFSIGDSMKFYGYLPSPGKLFQFSSVITTGNGTFGSGTYSVVSLNYDEPAGVETEKPERFDLKVDIFPNPNSGEFTMKFTGSERGTCRIKIFSILGELVDEFFTELSSNVAEFKISSYSRLPVGEYVLQIDLGERSIFEKFIIVR